MLHSTDDNLVSLCPSCSAERVLLTEDCACNSCGALIQSPFGVPILVPGAAVEFVHSPTDSLVDSLATALNSAEKKDALRQCFSIRIRMPNPSMQVESDQFLNRLMSGGVELAVSKSAENRRADDFGVNIIDKVAFDLDPLILPSAFKLGAPTSISVKIKNCGQTVLSSNGDNPFLLSYFWRPKKKGLLSRFKDKRISIEGRRTPLLIDLKPRCSITQGLFIDVPTEPGSWELIVAALVEQVTWFPAFSKCLTVDVQEGPFPQPYVHVTEGEPLSYSEQHIHGSHLLRDWVAKHIARTPPLVLEIGGNFHPSTEGYDIGRIVNLDVDAHGLMTRNIVKNDEIISVVGDGMNIPFPDRYFDVITMFASFHHFGDPIGLLKALAHKVKNDGLICLMCEPIGHVKLEHNYHQYINELEQGINEQSFEVWEYLAMADAANLDVIEAVFDRGAAMIALRPRA